MLSKEKSILDKSDLKYKYAEGCDLAIKEKDPAQLISLFTPDLIYDGGDFGRYEGMDQFKVFCKAAPEQIKFTYHYFTNAMITVNGDHASARWYILAMYTESDGRDTLLVGYEDDQYKKVNGQWLISNLKLVTGFYAPFNEGWSKLVMGK